ncbi:di-heme enzyme [Granulosicoccaceae sp. 1_MG-2023]|nr:di-heme enzyme [Granulosicoccaceae sp. 1_MG-2023]
MKQTLAYLSILGILSGCSASDNTSSADSYDWQLPEGFYAPPVPDDNPMSEAKVALGRRLFYDRRMSINETRSCGDCHNQHRAFTDGLPLAVGVTENEIHARNAQGLANVAYNATLTWANPNFLTLEHQALSVLLNEDPVELGWSDQEETILARLRLDPDYPQYFADAFPDQDGPFTIDNVLKALASFERTLISGNSPYDRFTNGDKDAISDSALRGMGLFFGERLECHHCHSGFNFATAVEHDGSFTGVAFHNNGLYNRDVDGDGIGDGAYPVDNPGLWEFTYRDTDMGRFRTPSLRNVELTAPYMHDGSIATLESVIVDHYARGGSLTESGPNAGDGAKSIYRSSMVVGFQLTDQELADVLAFLHSLTDWEFICDTRFSDPFGNIPMHENCAP